MLLGKVSVFQPYTIGRPVVKENKELFPSNTDISAYMHSLYDHKSSSFKLCSTEAVIITST